MRHAMPDFPFLSLRGYFILFVLLISSALLFPAQVKAAATGTIVEHNNGGQLNVGQMGTFTASCASGEQLLSGGFSGNAFEGAVFVSENYPSSSNSWTVTVNNTTAPSWVQVSVYVYCLQANYSIGTTIVQVAGSSSGTTMTTANCPMGSTLLSGGYSSGGGISIPNGNGWQSNGGRVYAACATQNFTAAPSVSTVFPVAGGGSSAGVAQCGSGQLATGGGFSANAFIVSSEAVINSDGTSTSWTTTVASVFNPGTATAWVVCVYPPGVHITYQVNAQWPGGFSVSLALTNTGSTAIHNWTLQFTFPGDQKITRIWNGHLIQSGEQVTITNMSYNGTIAPGQTLNLGFNGTWTASNTSPTTFTLNGNPTN